VAKLARRVLSPYFRFTFALLSPQLRPTFALISSYFRPTFALLSPYFPSTRDDSLGDRMGADFGCQLPRKKTTSTHCRRSADLPYKRSWERRVGEALHSKGCRGLPAYSSCGRVERTLTLPPTSLCDLQRRGRSSTILLSPVTSFWVRASFGECRKSITSFIVLENDPQIALAIAP